MRKILLFTFLLCSLFAQAQTNNIFSAGLFHSNGAPNFNPGARGCRLALDTTTQTFYLWKVGTTWVEIGQTIDQTIGCVPPAYTPTKWQSQIAVNGCSPIPLLYLHVGAGVWECLNCAVVSSTNLSWTEVNDSTYRLNSSTGTDVFIREGTNTTAALSGDTLTLSATGGDSTYTAGAGIDITGTVISNTGDLSATNELNSAFGINGTNLRITDAGGNLDVPLVSISPVQSVTAADFDLSAGVLALDYTNAQKATAIVPGFLSAADWATFNGKGSGTIGGSGTTNTIPKFTASGTIGNSVATDDGVRFDITGTSAFNLPTGTDAQRPATPTDGDFRNSTTSNNLEFRSNSAWKYPMLAEAASGTATNGWIPFASSTGPYKATSGLMYQGVGTGLIVGEMQFNGGGTTTGWTGQGFACAGSNRTMRMLSAGSNATAGDVSGFYGSVGTITRTASTSWIGFWWDIGQVTSGSSITDFTCERKSSSYNKAMNTIIGSDYDPTIIVSATNHYAQIWRSGWVGLGTATPERLFTAESADAVTNAVTYANRLRHTTSGTATTGFGLGYEVELENGSGTNRVASTQETTWTDAVNATEDATYTLKLIKAGTLTTAMTLNSVGDLSPAGDLVITTAGKGLELQTGTGQRFGNATLVGGTVTVTNATITANSYILLTRKTAGGTIGDLTYTLSAGASFTINSASGTDTSSVSYFIFEGN